MAELLALFPFQSTLPVWGGTCAKAEINVESLSFQSTLPVWGGTKNPV